MAMPITINNVDLTERAMIVRLRRHQWRANMRDRKATEAIAQNFQVATGFGAYRKTLLNTAPLREVRLRFSKLRDYHRSATLPWDDDGGRILPAANYFEYTKGIRKHKAACDKAVEQFVASYEDAKAEARQQLGALYNNDDYPTADALRAQFIVDIGIWPMPDADDFRVQIGGAQVDAIKKQITEELTQKYDEAMTELYDRVRKVVNEFRENAAAADQPFNARRMQNVVELVQLLPRLNLTGNGALEDVRKDIEAQLLNRKAADLKTDITARAAAAAAADSILNKMRTFKIGGTP